MRVCQLDTLLRLGKEPTALVRYPLRADLTGKRALLVDDVSDSGDTLFVALSHISERGEPADVRTAVLHHELCSSCTPDYYAQRVLRWLWISYPWAVAQDLGVLLARTSPRRADPEAIFRRLIDEHGLRIPRRVLERTLESRSLAGRC